jgi:hypothetical protein
MAGPQQIERPMPSQNPGATLPFNPSILENHESPALAEQRIFKRNKFHLFLIYLPTPLP